MIKLVYAHILLHLHTHSFSQTCSHLHPFLTYDKLYLAVHWEQTYTQAQAH